MNSSTSSIRAKCISFENTVVFNKEDLMTTLNLVTGYIILILGIIGNGLAIIANKATSTHLKCGNNRSINAPYINKFILKWFFIFSLLIVLTEIASPLMKVHGDYICCQTFWNSKKWNVYLAYVHYPITKTLMAFSFFLYFIFFGVQTMIVKYPTRFNSLVTKRRVIWIMLMCFVYSALWNIPTFRWFNAIEVFVCPKRPHLTRFSERKTNFVRDINESIILPILVYAYEIYVPSSSEKHPWQIYQMLRILCVNMIPFFALIMTKWIVIRKRRVITIFKVINSVTPSNLDRRIKIIKNINGHMEPSNARSRIRTIEGMNFELGNNSASKSRSKERKQHSKTLIILTFQFIIFLFPISIMEIIILHLLINHDKGSVSHWYIFLNTLQYMYYSLTFYINLSFNNIYREDVFKSLKRLVTNK
ncbi:unnamed protein product [Gordionus sp. m RMFG-2023]